MIRDCDGNIMLSRSVSNLLEVVIPRAAACNTSRPASNYTSGYDLARIKRELSSEHLRRGLHPNQPKYDDTASRIVFYNMRFCMYAHRTALVLLAKRLDFQNINIFLREKPEWFLRLTPVAKVPILIVGGHTRFESQITT